MTVRSPQSAVSKVVLHIYVLVARTFRLRPQQVSCRVIKWTLDTRPVLVLTSNMDSNFYSINPLGPRPSMIFIIFLPKWGHQPVRDLQCFNAFSKGHSPIAFSTSAAYLGMSSWALLPALESILWAEALISSKAAIFNALGTELLWPCIKHAIVSSAPMAVAFRFSKWHPKVHPQPPKHLHNHAAPGFCAWGKIITPGHGLAVPWCNGLCYVMIRCWRHHHHVAYVVHKWNVIGVLLWYVNIITHQCRAWGLLYIYTFRDMGPFWLSRALHAPAILTVRKYLEAPLYSFTV